MRLSNDLREFLELLNSRGVEYVIVGAHSLAFHGRPRYTGDLDILIRATPKNAAKIVNLLNEFGFAHSGFRESDFTEPNQVIQLGRGESDFTELNQVIQLGRAPNRIDLLSSISGVTTDEAFASKVSAKLDGIPIFILGKDALIQNKRAVGRPQDLADLDILES